ncbi:MAG TPA: PA14 domain-containing protein [Blastocatellia bacterium]|nr:PA14 domain-containing protein [Blastocatellia bacterium]
MPPFVPFVSYSSFGLLLFAFCFLQVSAQTFSSQTCFPSRPISIDRWRAEYFNNTDLNGAPALVRDDTLPNSRFLDFDWQLNSPSKDCGVNPDNFSVRWIRSVAFSGGSYHFTVTTDDGVRLFIDGQERLNRWSDQPLTTYTVDVQLSAGNHKITLEYYERWGSAVMKLNWQPHPCFAVVSEDHWRGEYFNNDSLTGQPAMARDDGEGDLFFDWHGQSPESSCGVLPSGFSARWSRRVPFGAGAYRFDVAAGVGARAFVDGRLLFDKWNGEATGSFNLQLGGGNHLLVFEVRGGASAPVGLHWKPLPCVAEIAEDHWRGEYFNSDNLSGNAVMVRDDGDRQIDFNWLDGSPAESCGVRRDGFSVRWTRSVAFDAGRYRFVVGGNDGIRFYVDGQLKVDEWREQSASFIAEIELTAGRHELKLEYVDFDGRAYVKLAWQPPPCITRVAAEHWRGEYFNNAELAGKPMLVRDEGDGQLNFDWGLGSPNSICGLSADNFSARLTRSAVFGDGVFQFKLTADDGVRVFIDGQLKLDHWREQMLTETFDVWMTAGQHRITIEYFERLGSAALKFSWQRHPCFADVPPDHWRGEYFNNTSLNGQPVMIRDDGDGALNFDWNVKSPGGNCGVVADEFSVRWTRRVILPAGVYRFTLTADDGARLFIDGKRVIDEWRDQPPTSFNAEVFLPEGSHRLVVEFYDRAGGATAKLEWVKIVRRPAQ